MMRRCLSSCAGFVVLLAATALAQTAPAPKGVDLGALDYASALSLQREALERVVGARGADESREVVFLVEHDPPVITITRRPGAASHLLASAERLAALGVEVQETDRGGDAPRRVRPGDIAVLFRSRESHREFERALSARAIRAYVYKGLGFYDSDEIKDLVALVRVLAGPESDLRAAAFLRSGLVGISDDALRRLAPEEIVGFELAHDHRNGLG